MFPAGCSSAPGFRGSASPHLRAAPDQSGYPLLSFPFRSQQRQDLFSQPWRQLCQVRDFLCFQILGARSLRDWTLSSMWDGSPVKDLFLSRPQPVQKSGPAARFSKSEAIQMWLDRTGQKNRSVIINVKPHAVYLLWFDCITCYMLFIFIKLCPCFQELTLVVCSYYSLFKVPLCKTWLCKILNWPVGPINMMEHII